MIERKCSADECGGDVEARGLCSLHYRRRLREHRDATKKSPAGDLLPHIPGVRYGAAGLELPEALRLDQWESLLAGLGRLDSGSNWWIGDAVLLGEKEYGSTYDLASKLTGLSPNTLKNRVYVSRNVPPEVRDPRVAWAVHRVVAHVRDEDEQRRWIARAAESGWAEAELRRQMGAPDSPEPPAPIDPDDLTYDYRCPRCEHEWSGDPKPQSVRVA